MSRLTWSAKSEREGQALGLVRSKLVGQPAGQAVASYLGLGQGAWPEGASGQRRGSRSSPESEQGWDGGEGAGDTGHACRRVSATFPCPAPHTTGSRGRCR